MMHLIVLILAAVSFFAAAVGATSRVNLVALGLLLWLIAANWV